MSEPPGPVSHRAPVEPVPLARRLLAPLAAVAVVIVVIVLLIVINGHNPKNPSGVNAGASPTVALSSATSTPAAPSPTPSKHPRSRHPAASKVSPTPRAHPHPHHGATGSTAPPRNTAMADVTVLNNSRVSGLAHHVAAEVGARGWRIAQVGNLEGLVPATTVFYAPGDEPAAAHLASEFGQIQQIEPDSEGRIQQPGLTLVVTRYWTG